jgi:hypothetical protein
MYPVDLMKVCPNLFSQLAEKEANRDFNPDTDANHKSFRRRFIYGVVTRSVDHIPDRRSTDAMERSEQCHRWSWCVAHIERVALSEKLTVLEQVRLMRYISARTRLSRKRPVETRQMGNITLLQLVREFRRSRSEYGGQVLTGVYSCQWRMCDNRERCSHESF